MVIGVSQDIVLKFVEYNVATSDGLVASEVGGLIGEKGQASCLVHFGKRLCLCVNSAEFNLSMKFSSSEQTPQILVNVGF